MAFAKIQRELKWKRKEYFQYYNHALIGCSRYTRSFLPSEFTIFQEGAPKYKVIERKNLIWFLRLVPILGLFVRVFLCRSFDILNCRDGEIVGKSTNRWWEPAVRYMLDGDIFELGVHKNEKFSLMKNESQIALYEKAEIALDGKNTYSVYYNGEESLITVWLFCVFIDVFYFDHDGMSIPIRDKTKISVWHDSCPERAIWRPKL